MFQLKGYKEKEVRPCLVDIMTLTYLKDVKTDVIYLCDVKALIHI